MSRKIGKLTALRVNRLTKPGRYGDGGGLWLQIAKNGGRSWLFRYMLNRKARAMGLGPTHTISLSEARGLAIECRRLLLQGIDPIEAKRQQALATQLDAARAITFKAAASAYIESHKAGWRNAKHIGQWRSTLETYAHPILGSLPVQAIDVTLVMKVLEPIWTKKPETASRLRGRIESILDWGTTRGYRRGENPARWRGHLENLLPAQAKVRKVRHHPALPYDELPSFMAALRTQEGIAARALEFLILTATRTSETLGARWNEINFAQELWQIPGDRMKSGRQHRIPLSSSALATLKLMHAIRQGDFVFAGLKADRPLSNMVLLMLLRRMRRGDLTAHGFRSTFRDWSAERTSYPREVAEAALAHVIPDAVERAYRRSDLFEKRRRLMAEWAKFCSSPPTTAQGHVVALSASA